MNRRTLTILGVAAGTIITIVLVLASIWPVIDTVETGETPEYHDIRPQYYTAETDRVLDACRDTVVAADDWSVESVDRRDLVVEATRVVSPLAFRFDVTIWIEPVTQHVTRVRLRSSSRTGSGDFGQNARNIRTFFARLDERLGGVKLDPNRRRRGADAGTRRDGVSPPEIPSPAGDTGTDGSKDAETRSPDVGREERDTSSP